MDVVKERKLRLLIELVEMEHQDRAYLELARAKRIDGMILLTPRIDDAGLRKLEQVDIPTVMMGELAGSNLYSGISTTAWPHKRRCNIYYNWDTNKSPVSRTHTPLIAPPPTVYQVTKMHSARRDRTQ